MEWHYNPITCQKIVDVTSLVAVYYMDLPRNFTFTPEQHRCWELNFLDYGENELYADGKEHTLRKHDMILYAPMVEHGILKKTEDASFTFSVSFESESPALNTIANQVIHIPIDLQKHISEILKLAHYFSDRGLVPNSLLSVDDQSALSEKERIVLQLIINLLEEFFLRIIDREKEVTPSSDLPKRTTENRQVSLSRAVQDYIDLHLDQKLTLQDISQHFNISVSKLCRDMKATTNRSLQELISDKRLKAAKRMICQDEYNFTEIAERLGFSSLHYFSQWFKKQTMRSPTEYATSVKGQSED